MEQVLARSLDSQAISLPVAVVVLELQHVALGGVDVLNHVHVGGQHRAQRAGDQHDRHEHRVAPVRRPVPDTLQHVGAHNTR